MLAETIKSTKDLQTKVNLLAHGGVASICIREVKGRVLIGARPQYCMAAGINHEEAINKLAEVIDENSTI